MTSLTRKPNRVTKMRNAQCVSFNINFVFIYSSHNAGRGVNGGIRGYTPYTLQRLACNAAAFRIPYQSSLIANWCDLLWLQQQTCIQVAIPKVCMPEQSGLQQALEGKSTQMLIECPALAFCGHFSPTGSPITSFPSYSGKKMPSCFLLQLHFQPEIPSTHEGRLVAILYARGGWGFLQTL